MNTVEELVTDAMNSNENNKCEGENRESQEDVAHSTTVADHSSRILPQVANESNNSSDKEDSGDEDEAQASKILSEEAEETVDVVFMTPTGPTVLTLPVLNISSQRARELLEQGGVQEIQDFRLVKSMERETEE